MVKPIHKLKRGLQSMIGVALPSRLIQKESLEVEVYRRDRNVPPIVPCL